MPEEGPSHSPYHREPSSSYPIYYQVPLPEEIQVSPGDTEIHRVEPEDVANHLTAFHWELFRCVHEVRLGRECACSWESAFAVMQPASPSWKAPWRHTHGQCAVTAFIGRPSSPHLGKW